MCKSITSFFLRASAPLLCQQGAQSFQTPTISNPTQHTLYRQCDSGSLHHHLHQSNSEIPLKERLGTFDSSRALPAAHTWGLAGSPCLQPRLDQRGTGVFNSVIAQDCWAIPDGI